MTHTRTHRDIPKRLWMFWHDGRPPPLASACIDNVRRLHSDWTVTVLTDADLPSVADRPDIHRLLPGPRRALVSR